MPRGRTTNDPATLAMALVGYELERQRIDQRISEIRAQLGGRGSASAAAVKRGRKQTGGKRKPLSMAARKRIAAAQRRRWAEHRKKTAQSAKSE